MIIFLLEFSNMGLVVLVTGFDYLDLVKRLTGNLKISGKIRIYEGFDPDWYREYGVYICLTLYMSAFISSGADIVEFVIV